MERRGSRDLALERGEPLRITRELSRPHVNLHVAAQAGVSAGARIVDVVVAHRGNSTTCAIVAEVQPFDVCTPRRKGLALLVTKVVEGVVSAGDARRQMAGNSGYNGRGHSEPLKPGQACALEVVDPPVLGDPGFFFIAR